MKCVFGRGLMGIYPLLLMVLRIGGWKIKVWSLCYARDVGGCVAFNPGRTSQGDSLRVIQKIKNTLAFNF